jgi:hypothetical protein
MIGGFVDLTTRQVLRIDVAGHADPISIVAATIPASRGCAFRDACKRFCNTRPIYSANLPAGYPSRPSPPPDFGSTVRLASRQRGPPSIREGAALHRGQER